MRGLIEVEAAVAEVLWYSAVELRCLWPQAVAVVLETMPMMAMEIQVPVDPQVVIIVAILVDQAVEVEVLVETIRPMPVVELAGIIMVVVLLMEREEKIFPMVDKVVSDILVKVAMADLAAALDPTQELEAAADIPAAAQETGATLVMAVAADPI